MCNVMTLYDSVMLSQYFCYNYNKRCSKIQKYGGVNKVVECLVTDAAGDPCDGLKSDLMIIQSRCLTPDVINLVVRHC